ncbi:MAG: tRNA pseudouridine(38-40) synthase TruA [Holosporaceae bacterium]|jgi:tRNA pseudouridine38-40 synthase|nr:tRNA pseudouridine(38-40) synthase TruA [Holosporaceae bacterium]
MARYRIIVEYDGSPFHGWQRQENYDTVQQRLEEAISPMVPGRTVMHGAGRTDAGVHAFGQAAHFDVSGDFECFRIQECMNAHLVEAPITVLSVEKVADDFDARFGAVERSYLYRILNRRPKPSLEINRAWHVVQALDADRMHRAAQHLVGNHDFSTFRAANCIAKSPLKTLNSISVRRDGDLVLLEVAARSFLYHQVRNIVGSLCFVGAGRWSEEDFVEIFLAKDRKRAGPTAPACGLYFSWVRY